MSHRLFTFMPARSGLLQISSLVTEDLYFYDERKQCDCEEFYLFFVWCCVLMSRLVFHCYFYEYVLPVLAKKVLLLLFWKELNVPADTISNGRLFQLFIILPGNIINVNLHNFIIAQTNWETPSLSRARPTGITWTTRTPRCLCSAFQYPSSGHTTPVRRQRIPTLL